ncbi:MAG: hypothetical protein KDA80_20465, partial [Planctomycetaceae bacterium]|nr:hypothetical protein [Planctomycetaceae bacterium]
MIRQPSRTAGKETPNIPQGYHPCGRAGFAECAINQIADGCDLDSSAQCPACGKTVFELEEQFASVGNILRQSSSASADEPVIQELIEAQAGRLCEVRTDPIPQEIGAYQIHEVLGQGGMGTVYRATHKHLGKQVAIKLLSTRWAGSPTALARFEREMKAVGKLDHPHV